MGRTRAPTVYVDTNIISALYYRGDELTALHQLQITSDWWSTERKKFRLFASMLTETELRAGKYPGRRHAISAVRRIPYLAISGVVQLLAQELRDIQIVPETKIGDAVQLSLATAHRIDYLPSWNYAHLANPETQRRLNDFCRRRGWRPPILVSPETIPRTSLGQVIGRPADGN